MHFKQEFKFKLGNRVIYKDLKSGETEEVTGLTELPKRVIKT